MKVNRSKHVGILGANGLLGSDLVTYLQKDYKVTSITRQNYDKIIGKSFDVFINANGNSKKYWANQNPVEDFSMSTLSVIKSFFDFPSDMYIYISSVDVYPNHTHPRFTKESSHIVSDKLDIYGLHKYLAELAVRRYKKRYIIIRPSSILGTQLSKGPVYDILKERDMFIASNSKLQFITAQAIAKVIHSLLVKKTLNTTINVGGRGSVQLGDAQKIIGKGKSKYPKRPTQVYEMNVTKLKKIYPKLKTSTQYLSDYLLTVSKSI